MNYTLNSIKINSDWFDIEDRKKNVYQKIGYKGLNIYFHLYKFRLHNQEDEHTFLTSISMLRKETGYKTEEILELLKKLKSAKVVKINNLSRWDYLVEKETQKIKGGEILHITALDTFSIGNETLEKGRYYIYVPLTLFDLYKEKGLNEKYYALYCLIAKWSHNTENKMFMSIEKMSNILGFDKDYINQMIYNMNRHYFLCSNRRRRKKGSGWQFEHYILNSSDPEKIEKFVKTYKVIMDRLIKRVDARKNSKKAIDIESALVEIESNEKQEIQKIEELIPNITKRVRDKIEQPSDEDCWTPDEIKELFEDENISSLF